jgi:hypothetical protein
MRIVANFQGSPVLGDSKVSVWSTVGENYRFVLLWPGGAPRRIGRSLPARSTKPKFRFERPYSIRTAVPLTATISMPAFSPSTS